MRDCIVTLQGIIDVKVSLEAVEVVVPYKTTEHSDLRGEVGLRFASTTQCHDADVD